MASMGIVDRSGLCLGVAAVLTMLHQHPESPEEDCKCHTTQAAEKAKALIDQNPAMAAFFSPVILDAVQAIDAEQDAGE